MNLKITFYIILLFGSTHLFSQIENDSIDKIKIVPKVSVLDSLKATFINHSELSKIDNLWMKELSNTELSDTQFVDILNINPDENVVYDLPTEVLKERLAKLDAKSPFNIEYNIGLENVIKSLLKNRKKSYERLLGISQYYFPLFEDALAKYNIPIEIKYLAIVESALNPKAKSRVGATGLWQFMYATGLQYKLEVNSYVDERSDPIKATEAACKYLSNMFTIFGDWDLVLASYNCGPGNVTKAIRRSNGQKNYWNIRKKLPRETAGYLPAFLATMYIMEYHKDHGINKPKALVNYFATDTIVVKNQLSFNQISKLIDIPEEELKFLNPSYKLNVIPVSDNKRNYIRLPQDKIAVFTSNEDKIYYYANYEANLREKPNTEPIAVKDTLNYFSNDKKIVTKNKSYKVKRGDSLDEIANKFDVSIADIKKWNNLDSDKAPKGKKLKIQVTQTIVVKTKHAIKKDENVLVAENSTENKPAVVVNEKPTTIIVEEKPSAKGEFITKTEKVTTIKEVTKLYKVKKGDNLSEIADRFNVASADIKKWNKLKNNNVVKGKSLKIITNEKVTTTIKKKVKKESEAVEPETVVNLTTKAEKLPKNDYLQSTFTIHKFQKTDDIAVIAKENNCTVAQLVKWNNIVANNVKAGTELMIYKSEPQAESNKTVDAKANNHVVAKGENIWKIAEKYSVTAKSLRLWNNLKSDELKVGTLLIVGNPENSVQVAQEATKVKSKIAENKTKEKLYSVKKGDSLFSISQKYPGVTVTDIKKWNDIRDGKIKPGMKLKIII